MASEHAQALYEKAALRASRSSPNHSTAHSAGRSRWPTPTATGSRSMRRTSRCSGHRGRKRGRSSSAASRIRGNPYSPASGLPRCALPAANRASEHADHGTEGGSNHDRFGHQRHRSSAGSTSGARTRGSAGRGPRAALAGPASRPVSRARRAHDRCLCGPCSGRRGTRTPPDHRAPDGDRRRHGADRSRRHPVGRAGNRLGARRDPVPPRPCRCGRGCGSCRR